MDVDKLLKALNNEDNSHLLDLTNDKIMQIKIDILKELGFSRNKLLDVLKSLKYYRYVDGMNELCYGSYIRWIPITNPAKIELTKGSIFCEFKVTDNGVYVVCKNFMNKYHQFKLEENLIFQKITDQEHVLLSALDHLSK
jgi:hypothetical protein